MLHAFVVVSLAIALMGSAIAAPSATAKTRSRSSATLLFDDFSGMATSADRWHIPTWTSPTDGTYLGRTQYRVAQSSPLPPVSSGNVAISVQSYNPTGLSFYGTDLISNASFSSKESLVVRVRARIAPPVPPGVVGGIFLYALKPGSKTLHDEIDFELLSKRPNEIQTNIYGNEPLGKGHAKVVPYPSGSIFDYHTYKIWLSPGGVTWNIDGHVVRKDTSHVPSGPMYLHLNMWVPGKGWPGAFSSRIRPARSQSSNQSWWMYVDNVSVTTMRRKRSGEGK